MLAGLKPSVGTVGDAQGQRARRNDDRALQDRVHPRRLTVSARADPHPGRPGAHHLRVGGLVQLGPADAPTQPTPAHRSRGRVLRARPCQQPCPTPVGIGLAHRIGSGAPVSPPSPGRITEPVLREEKQFGPVGPRSLGFGVPFEVPLASSRLTPCHASKTFSGQLGVSVHQGNSAGRPGPNRTGSRLEIDIRESRKSVAVCWVVVGLV